jgi:ElaB/YqjD/DUF883 family membrane-anchored ribosome-binding protein
MSRKKRSKDFPYFTEYVAYQANQPVGSSSGVGFLIGGLIAIAFAAVPLSLFFSEGVLFSLVTGGLLAIAGLWLGSVGVKRMAQKRKLPTSYVEAVDAAREFHQLVLKKRLTSWVDPVALELLEAGAYHHRRVADVIERWPSTAGGHWDEVRDQAREAADDAMHELLRMFVKCIGKPQKQRKDAWGDVIDDFVDLDFADALEGLKRISDGDWRDYAYTSPVTQRLFEPGRQIAEKLKTLADEIERSLTERSADSFMATKSSSSIDGVLGQISAVRQAEEELREHQPRG